MERLSTDHYPRSSAAGDSSVTGCELGVEEGTPPGRACRSATAERPISHCPDNIARRVLESALAERDALPPSGLPESAPTR